MATIEIIRITGVLFIAWRKRPILREGCCAANSVKDTLRIIDRAVVKQWAQGIGLRAGHWGAGAHANQTQVTRTPTSNVKRL